MGVSATPRLDALLASRDNKKLTIAQREALERAAMREAEGWALARARAPREGVGSQPHEHGPWHELAELVMRHGGPRETAVFAVVQGSPSLAHQLRDEPLPPCNFAQDLVVLKLAEFAIHQPDLSPNECMRRLFAGDPRLHRAYMAERRGGTPQHAQWEAALAVRRGKGRALVEAQAEARAGAAPAAREAERRVAKLMSAEKITEAQAYKRVWGADNKLWKDWQAEKDAARQGRE